MKKQKVVSFEKEKNEPWVNIEQLKDFLDDVEDGKMPVAIYVEDDLCPFIILERGEIQDIQLIIQDGKDGVNGQYDKVLVLYPQQ